MNIVKTEISYILEARISGFNEKKNISYHFIESAHSLRIDKIQITSEQIHACERLLKHTKDQTDQAIIKKEISELKFALDLFQV